MNKKMAALAAFLVFQPLFAAHADGVVVEGSRVSQSPDGIIRVAAPGPVVIAKEIPTSSKTPVYSSSGNHGVLSGTEHPAVVSRPAETSTGNSFADREAWRSGVAGTFSMWGQLFQRALPSNEALPQPKKKK